MDDITQNLEYIKKFTRSPTKDGIRDRSGNYLTRGLFLETSKYKDLCDSKYHVAYTLTYNDIEKVINGEKKTIKSLYKIFMSSRDEYDFAISAFNSYQQLQVLLTTDWFSAGIKGLGFYGFHSWCKEKEMRDRSRNLERILTQAEMGNMQGIKLLEERYKDARPKGRPTKEDKDRLEKERVEFVDEIKKIKLRLIKSDAKESPDSGRIIKSS